MGIDINDTRFFTNEEGLFIFMRNKERRNHWQIFKKK